MTYEQLYALFQQALPGEMAHHEFLPLRGSSREAIAGGAPYRRAAVAIVLFYNARNQLATVVIQRPIYEGTHSGQISFPGGKHEKSDESLEATARRECEEEIGISLHPKQLLGPLSQVYIPVSQFLISPFVYFSSHRPTDYRADTREVTEIHEIELNELFAKSSKQLIDVPLNENTTLKNVPHFTTSSIKIWGATALMLNELKHLIVSGN